MFWGGGAEAMLTRTDVCGDSLESNPMFLQFISHSNVKWNPTCVMLICIRF